MVMAHPPALLEGDSLMRNYTRFSRGMRKRGLRQGINRAAALMSLLHGKIAKCMCTVTLPCGSNSRYNGECDVVCSRSISKVHDHDLIGEGVRPCSS